jgi:vacuolar-type H+-ATPase subunit I/STV1
MTKANEQTRLLLAAHEALVQRLEGLAEKLGQLNAQVEAGSRELRWESYNSYAGIGRELEKIRLGVEERFDRLEIRLGRLEQGHTAIRRELNLVELALLTTSKQAAAALENTRRIGFLMGGAGMSMDLLKEWPAAEVGRMPNV